MSGMLGPDKDIAAPDIGTDEQTMAWMMDTYSVSVGRTSLGMVTGKPLALGGSLGRKSATSRGVVHVAFAALAHRGIAVPGAKASVQGFGKVGKDAALFLHKAGVDVVAISDQYGGIFDEQGIDVPLLEQHVASTGSVRGFTHARPIPSSFVLETDVDLLVPAAVESVLDEHNASRVRAPVIVEGANGPTTPAADRILAARDQLVVPDILANAGGVVVSYFEWVQANQAYWWSSSDVENRLQQRMLAAWERVLQYSLAQKVTLREAATALAVHNVIEAHVRRGLYP
jgi:glutamate dehydrogenase (NAD(P)+)